VRLRAVQRLPDPVRHPTVVRRLAGHASGMLSMRYKDGQSGVAPYLFTVVQEDGQWKIAHEMMMGG
jgi:hypothetical protein